MYINVESYEQFNELIASGVTLVDFWAPWCGPCRMLAPYIEQVSEEMPQVKVIKVNVDEQEQIAREFQISAIPTVMLFVNNEKVATNVGFMNKPKIIEFIESNL
ncbi:MAG: thioredoxin [Bacillales bacterium]|nr:thioredoxin [Bacillales bacterium]